MKSHIRQALTIEIIKLIKNKTIYLYIGAISIFLFALSFITQVIDSSTSITNGYFFMTFSLQTLSTTIFPFILIIYSANTVASEKIHGTIRNILVSGISRMDFFIAKLLAAFVFVIILLTISVVIVSVVGSVGFGFNTISEDGFTIMSQSQFWVEFLLSIGVLTLILFAIVSFGILISSVAHSPIAAVIITLCSYVVLETIKSKLHVEKFVCFSYLDFPLGRLGNLIEGFRTTWIPIIYYCAIVSFLWIAVSSILSIVVIRKLEFK